MKYGIVGEDRKTGEKYYYVKAGSEGGKPVLSTNISDMFCGWDARGASFKSSKLDKEFPGIHFAPYPFDEDLYV